MKIEIYKPAAEKEPTLRLTLYRLSSGSVDLVAVDKHGMTVAFGHLLRIHPDGTIQRLPSVNQQLGLSLDDQGRVIIQDD